MAVTATITGFEPETIITIPGIGDAGPEYYTGWKVAETLQVPASQVCGYYYEDIMDGDDISIFAKAGARLAAMQWGGKLAELGVEKPVDYLADIFVFFLSAHARQMMEARLIQLLASHSGTFKIFAHSLGSIFLYWFCCRNPQYARRIDMVTLGSPLGSPLLSRIVKRRLRKILDMPLSRPTVLSWVNVYSDWDRLSGKITGLGCQEQDQVHATWNKVTFHRQVSEYIKAYVIAYE